MGRLLCVGAAPRLRHRGNLWRDVRGFAFGEPSVPYGTPSPVPCGAPSPASGRMCSVVPFRIERVLCQRKRVEYPDRSAHLLAGDYDAFGGMYNHLDYWACSNLPELIEMLQFPPYPRLGLQSDEEPRTSHPFCLNSTPPFVIIGSRYYPLRIVWELL